jgi:uncharacterized protein
MLVASNVFMTFTWYGYLKFKESPLWMVILASWGIAFFEYCIQVPANRLGSSFFSIAQLKVAQEVITLSVFAAFSVFYLKEELKWNYLIGFILILLAVFFVFKNGNDVLFVFSAPLNQKRIRIAGYYALFFLKK